MKLQKFAFLLTLIFIAHEATAQDAAPAAASWYERMTASMPATISWGWRPSMPSFEALAASSHKNQAIAGVAIALAGGYLAWRLLSPAEKVAVATEATIVIDEKAADELLQALIQASVYGGVNTSTLRKDFSSPEGRSMGQQVLARLAVLSQQRPVPYAVGLRKQIVEALQEAPPRQVFPGIDKLQDFQLRAWASRAWAANWEVAPTIAAFQAEIDRMESYLKGNREVFKKTAFDTPADRETFKEYSIDGVERHIIIGNALIADLRKNPKPIMERFKRIDRMNPITFVCPVDA